MININIKKFNYMILTRALPGFLHLILMTLALHCSIDFQQYYLMISLSSFRLVIWHPKKEKGWHQKLNRKRWIDDYNFWTYINADTQAKNIQNFSLYFHEHSKSLIKIFERKLVSNLAVMCQVVLSGKKRILWHIFAAQS